MSIVVSQCTLPSNFDCRGTLNQVLRQLGMSLQNKDSNCSNFSSYIVRSALAAWRIYFKIAHTFGAFEKTLRQRYMITFHFRRQIKATDFKFKPRLQCLPPNLSRRPSRSMPRALNHGTIFHLDSSLTDSTDQESRVGLAPTQGRTPHVFD